MRLFYGIVLTAVFSAASVMAEEPARPDGPLAQAIAEAAAQEIAGRYAYIRHIRVDAKDEVLDKVERYDPDDAAGDGWTLLTVDGKEATAEDIEDYAADDHSAEGADDPFTLYREVVGDLKFEDAVLLEETGSRAEYRLLTVDHALFDEDSDDFAGQLVAHLVVDKTGPSPFVSLYRVYAPEPFRKAMVAKVNAFETVFSFMRYDETGDVLPQSVRVHLSVEALLFIDIDADTNIAFRDYQYRGSDR